MFTKNTTLLGLLCFAATYTTSAQSAVRSLSCGYNARIEIAVSQSANTWLVGGFGEPMPGAFYEDTLFLASVRDDGAVLQRANLPLPSSEVHYWLDLLPFANGDALVVFESTLCDVVHDILTVRRINSKGETLWQLQNAPGQSSNRPPEKWFVAPDGNLLGYTYNKVWKLEAGTGNILWQAPLTGIGTSGTAVLSMILLPGTEDFIAIGYPSFQVWRKNSGATPTYTMSKQVSQTGGFKDLKLGPDGWVYCKEIYPNPKILRLNADLTIQALPVVLENSYFAGFVPTTQHLYVFDRANGLNRFRRFDLQGQNAETLTAPQPYFSGNMAGSNGRLIFYGTEETGLPVLNSSPRGAAAWLALFNETDLYSPSGGPDVALVALEQHKTIDTTQIPAWPSGYLYNLRCGGFRLQIENRGQETLESVCCNTSIGIDEYYFVCFRYNAAQRCFDGLHLAPGESAWLDFGDIQADGILEIPTDLCFWTSSPNERPDVQIADDVFCKAFSLSVAAGEPEALTLQLFPNPADGSASLRLPLERNANRWQLTDLSGRTVAQGDCLPDSDVSVPTAHLPGGIYFLRAGERTAKLAVRH